MAYQNKKKTNHEKKAAKKASAARKKVAVRIFPASVLSCSPLTRRLLHAVGAQTP